MKPNVTVILGPTASGKTQYGIERAHAQPSAIISADSRQVYTSMDIGTAKPSEAHATAIHDILVPDVAQGIDHYLFNARTPDAPLSLADWQDAAQRAITHVINQHKHPIIVGGTMLYIDSIVRNYHIPEVPPNTALREELEQQDTNTLFTTLIKKDPKAVQYIEKHNKRRIVRALEVMHATGQTFSTLRQQRPSPYTFTLTGIFPGWDALQTRIKTRSQHMFDHGLVEETASLRDMYGDTLPLLQTMGYKQAMDVLTKKSSQEDAVQEYIQVCSRYARRQLSWWRGREEITWIDETP